MAGHDASSQSICICNTLGSLSDQSPFHTELFGLYGILFTFRFLSPIHGKATRHPYYLQWKSDITSCFLMLETKPNELHANLISAAQNLCSNWHFRETQVTSKVARMMVSPWSLNKDAWLNIKANALANQALAWAVDSPAFLLNSPQSMGV